MANIKQQMKRVRQDKGRNAANRARLSRIRSYVKRAEEAIVSGDVKKIPAAFKRAMVELHKGAQKGLLKDKAASRKISRLAAMIRGKTEKKATKKTA